MVKKYGKKAASAITVFMIISIVFSSLSISAFAAESKSSKPKYKIPAATEKRNTFAKTYKYVVKGKTSYGYDWSYNTYSKDIKVTCKYSFKDKNYTFRVKGTKYGLVKVILKYKKNDKSWISVPMKVFVDPKKNIMRVKM